jgi:hypothetical protein
VPGAEIKRPILSGGKGEKVLFVNGCIAHFADRHRPEWIGYGQDRTQGSAAMLSTCSAKP